MDEVRLTCLQSGCIDGTLTGEHPPSGTVAVTDPAGWRLFKAEPFSYHGTSWNLPVGGTFGFEKIPIPADP